MNSPMEGLSWTMEEGFGGLLGEFERGNFLGFIEKHSRIYATFFIIGFVGGFPLAETAIDWLLGAEGFVPDGVQIIILQPLEVIMLQLRIAAQIGFALMALSLIVDISWNGKSVISENAGDFVGKGRLFEILMVIACVVFLGFCGAFYSHEVLVPFLLQYLSEDAAASGLQSTWQLNSWIGFISGLYFSSIIGFQVPIVLVLSLRSGLIERDVVIENRGFLWFSALFFGALISPPDPISLFLVGGPILLLMEISLAYERLTKMRD